MQRVCAASVSVGGSVVSAIDRGALCLVGVAEGDNESDVSWACGKLQSVRLWPDAAQRPWRTSARDARLPLLLVSQFTLHAALKGSRPDFHAASGTAFCVAV